MHSQEPRCTYGESIALNWRTQSPSTNTMTRLYYGCTKVPEEQVKPDAPVGDEPGDRLPPRPWIVLPAVHHEKDRAEERRSGEQPNRTDAQARNELSCKCTRSGDELYMSMHALGGCNGQIAARWPLGCQVRALDILNSYASTVSLRYAGIRIVGILHHWHTASCLCMPSVKPVTCRCAGGDGNVGRQCRRLSSVASSSS